MTRQRHRVSARDLPPAGQGPVRDIPDAGCYAPAMTTDGPPTLADQVSRLYDLIAGYHATHRG